MRDVFEVLFIGDYHDASGAALPGLTQGRERTHFFGLGGVAHKGKEGESGTLDVVV